MPLARSLPRIFAPPIVWRIATYGEELRPLRGDESETVSRAVDKRQQEFRAGRHCAHAAMSAIGVECESLLSDPRGAPLWPSDAVGSIAHTGKLDDGWAIAVAALKKDVRALGVDIERSDPVSNSLVERILSPGDVAALDTRDVGVAQWGKIAFSCKEAAYKCQYPITGEFLEFHDFDFEPRMEPAVADTGLRHGVFRARFQRDVGVFRVGDPLFGRFALTDRWVIAGVTMGY